MFGPAHDILILRPEIKNALFPVTSPILIGSVGSMANFYFIKTFLYVKSIKILLKKY